jgi:hypothetical protein
MSNLKLSSKIIKKEEKPRIRNLQTGQTAVIGVEGVAERGPINTPTLCSSWDDYVKTFGWFTTDGDLATVVWNIYQEHPSAWVYVNRIVHYGTISLPATITSAAATSNILGVGASAGVVTGTIAGPWNLAPSDTIIVHVDEDGGGPDTATITATAAAATGTNTETFAITNGWTLTFDVESEEDTQTATFNTADFVAIGAATAEEISVVINTDCKGVSANDNGSGAVIITSDRVGSSSALTNFGGTAATALGFSASASGTGNVANVDAVTAAELKTIIEAAVTNPATGCTVSESTSGYLVITSNTTGTSSYVQVETASTADDEIGLDNTLHQGTAVATVIVADGKTHGTYAHDLRVVIGDATNGEATYFNLSVTDADGVVLEVFPNLQNSDSTAVDFVDTVVNDTNTGSLYIEVTDQSLASRPTNATYTPSGGDDGLTSIADTDWLGDSSGLTGLHAFNHIDDITLMLDGGRATSAWQAGLISYVETYRDGLMFAVLDPPAGYSHTQMITWMGSGGANLKNLSEYGAIYWPRLKVINIDTTVFGTSSDTITVPCSGVVAGVMSRQDNSKDGGIYTNAANVENGILSSVLGFENDNVKNPNIRDLIYPHRINPLTVKKGYPRHVDGVWTLKETGDFPTVAERRGVILIERTIINGLEFVRHRNNDRELRDEAHRTVEQFLGSQMSLGAFRTKDPETAFYVDFSEALNTPAVINSFQLLGRIGLATQKPNEWTTLSFSQYTAGAEAEISAGL